MQEYSHLPFRLLCKEYDAGLVFTEMVNTRHILEYKDKLSDLELLSSCKEENPVAVQLFGDFSEKDLTIKAAHLLDSYKHFDVIDFNLGCPSLKIINSKSGSYNLKQLDKVLPVIKEITATCKKPITIKTRLGFSENNFEKNFNDFLKTGISALTVHGRLAVENYSHASRIDVVNEITRNSSIPLIYNGDVSSNNLEKLNAFPGLMVGREAMGNPFIFKQIDVFSKTGNLLENDSSLKALDSFMNNVSKYPISYAKLKASVIPFFKGRIGSSKIREEISSTKDVFEIKEILKRLKEQQE
jgi:tRNA-dihydrouridine synthase B